MTEESIPANVCSIRRKSVAAEKYDPEVDDEEDTADQIVHPKTDEQRTRLKESVRNIFLFRSLDDQQTLEVIDAMFEIKVRKGDRLIEEGDDGDNFYAIERYDVIVGGQKVSEYVDQGSFGELALMYNMPRAATIIATSDGKLWAMSRKTFRRIVLRCAFNKRKMYEAFIENVSLLQSLDFLHKMFNVFALLLDDALKPATQLTNGAINQTPYERMNVADALVTHQYEDGDVIIKQGDEADCMFIVENGEVSIVMRSDKHSTEKEISRCGKGAYFGELALVTHKPRAASAYAVGHTQCAVLDVAAFERLLGPCMEVMKRNVAVYRQQLVEIFGSETAASGCND